jgi:hypothetical protein
MPPGKPASVTAWKRLERADRKRRRLAIKAKKAKLYLEVQLRRKQAKEAAAAAKIQAGPPSLLTPCKALDRRYHCRGCGGSGHYITTCSSQTTTMACFKPVGVRTRKCRACGALGHTRRHCRVAVNVSDSAQTTKFVDELLCSALQPSGASQEESRRCICNLCGAIGHSHVTCTADADKCDAAVKEAFVDALLRAARVA